MIIEQKFPLFEKGRIIKKDALDLVRDYAPQALALLFQSYGDGIISGFEISGCRDGIVIKPGILKDGSGFFCMKEEVFLECGVYGHPVQITLRKCGGGRDADYQTDAYELILEPVRELEEGVFELGRFRLEKGAKLRSCKDYKDFFDLATEFNTLNLVYARYACENGSVLSPLILKMYGQGIIKSPKAEPLDLSFAMLCLNSQGISADLLSGYLSVKLGKDIKKCGNPENYRDLGRLYNAIVSGSEARRSGGGRVGKTMID